MPSLKNLSSWSRKDSASNDFTVEPCSWSTSTPQAPARWSQRLRRKIIWQPSWERKRPVVYSVAAHTRLATDTFLACRLPPTSLGKGECWRTTASFQSFLLKSREKH